MKSIIIYSSVTGNTRSVAEAIRQVLPRETRLASVDEAPDPACFDFLVLGFWVRRGKPDPKMLRYMERVQGKLVACFGTLAAYPDSDHARLVRQNAESLLRGNIVVGHFLCQGRLEAGYLASLLDGTRAHASHPMTEERRQRLLEANAHPNESDFAAAGKLFADLYRQASAQFEH